MDNDNVTVRQFIEHVNSLRLRNKNLWQEYHGEVNGKCIGIKFYNTWTQIIQIEECRASGNMGLNVRQWIDELKKFLGA